MPEHGHRSLSDGSLFKKWKLKKHGKHKKKKEDGKLQSQSQSQSQIATRRVQAPAGDAPVPAALPQIKLNLPDIASIRTSRSAARSRPLAGAEQDDGSTESEGSRGALDLAFVPRRSLQNSAAGVTRNSAVGQPHGFFNIPVPIDSHGDHQSSLTAASSAKSAPPLNNNTAQPHRTQVQHPPTQLQQSQPPERDTSTGSIVGTILSMAHNAIGHLPRGAAHTDGPIQSINGTSTPEESSPVRRTRHAGQPTMDDSTIENTVIHRIPNAQHAGDGTTGLEQPPPVKSDLQGPPVNRSGSFLRNLDYLLSPTAADIDNIEDNKLLADANPDPRHALERAETGKFTIADNSSNKVTFEAATQGSKDSAGDLRDSVPQQAQVQPLREGQNSVLPQIKQVSDDLGGSAKRPAITSLGSGNLTLDIFTNDNNTDEMSSMDQPRRSTETVANGQLHHENASSQGILRPALANNYSQSQRNSSYIDVTKHNPINLSVSTASRVRSKTMPTNDMNNVHANEPVQPRSSEQGKRNSVHSVTSTSEENTSSRGRKPRTSSKNFLNRRSFSPGNISKVVVPSLGLRNSMSRVKNNLDVSESLGQQRTRMSTNFSGGANPVVNVDYSKPTELKGLDYASEKRNIEFHNLFKEADLSSHERLIVDHSCALSRDILLQGRIYISDQHLCFYSNILGWVSTVIIPFKEIVQIEKKTTAGIFPNGIVIDTLHTKYVFASFISRDSTFDLITDVWNQIILGRRYLKDGEDGEVPMDSHSSYSLSGFDGGLGEDDDGDEEDDDDDEAFDDDDDDNASLLGVETDMTSSDELNPDELPSSKGKLVPFPGPVKHSPTSMDYKPVDNEKLVSETVIDAPLGQVAEVLYGDDVSRLELILKSQKNFDLSPIPKLLKNKTRDYNYYKPLHFGFGPNKTKCLITDTVEHYDLNDYVQVYQESKTPDVPSGNSFTVRINTIMTWDSDNTTKVTVYFLCEWSSKSWLKSAIEKGAFDGVLETTRIQNVELANFAKNQSPKISKRSSSKRAGGEKPSEDDIVSSLPTLGPPTHDPTEPEYLKSKEDIIIEQSVNFNAPLGTVFQMLYGDDTSYLKNIIEKQNNFDISSIPKFVNNEREYTYTKRLGNALGPKQTRCTLNEKIEHMDINSYIAVRQTVKSHDVPYGSVFTVHTRMFYSWGPNNTTNMLVVLNVVWSGKSLLKGTIEKGSIDGQKAGTKVLVETLNEIITNGSKKKARKRSKTTTRGSSTRSKLSTPKHNTTAATSSNDADSGMLSTVISMIENFNIPFVSGNIAVAILAVFFILVLTYMLGRSSNRHAFELAGPGRILIDGQEFSYIPNFKTLYQVYEDEVRKTVKDIDSDKANAVRKSQGDIWDWIDDRSNGACGHKMDSGLVSRRLREKAMRNTGKGKKAKQLKNSIEVTELQLQEMREMLSRLQD
ncbi:Ysp2p KNAG_0C05400 [Huiozyma naganishii CBS 8797]|uniref:VASt domain-containing protein n=1 Tax=Huiozyma naganishii (strain ATCC MYA-139 / BCRC 22969 / CBS 8797 / KCTC 17520 / NBRC 10181 / NCYC 3082 / Yp74L-3) TaxID=1071383 RepID=J7RJE1_HUIN7|nr:hypothetical protein KNAG_0C05400 [Kazachstania naganishii CBS 8797]CCK69638.1 hypothetical protein KNAG_0C05400 [Kazachstania naganishii CBS 8797]